jgi:hypothetical protein
LVGRTETKVGIVQTLLEELKQKLGNNNNGWQTMTIVWGVSTIVGRVIVAAGKTTIMVGRQRQWWG